MSDERVRVLRRRIAELKGGLRRCGARVTTLELHIANLIDAVDSSEMSNEQAAIARLRLDLEEA